MRTRFATVITLLVATLATATPVVADCDLVGTPAEVLATAEVAFVGTVVEVDGSFARFDVLEDWTDAVGDAVEVVGLAHMFPRGGDPGAMAEDDRTWVAGATYLVIPFVDGGLLRDHICTATTEWTDALAALRPRRVEAVVGGAAPADARSALPLPVLLIGVAAVAVAGASVLAFRRRT